MRPGYFYAFSIKGLFQAKSQLTHHRPLLDGFDITQDLDLYPGVAQVIHPEYLRRSFNHLALAFICSQLLAYTVYYTYGVVKVGTIGHRDIKINPGEVSGVVAGYPNLAIGDMVDYPV